MGYTLYLLLLIFCRISMSCSLGLSHRSDISACLLSQTGVFLTSRPTEDGVETSKDKLEPSDTIRVRIWRALASGEELSLRQLGSAVGERRQGELRSHLKHVEIQAQTLRNKSVEWRVRRGLDPATSSLRLVTRQQKKDIFVRLK